MKNQISTLKIIGALALCLTALPSARFAADGNNEKAEAEIIKLEKQWDAAFVAVDVPVLEATLADDYISTDDTGETHTKKSTIEDLKSKTDLISASSATEIKVTVYGNAAVATGRWTSKETYKGKDVSGAFRFTDTWVKRNGRWQCVADHFSRITGEK